jgi:glycosyltransferase involved in cell wall biosynthesis
MARQDNGDKPILVTQLVNCLGIGGTERQLVEHLRRLDRARFTADLACLHKVGEYLPVVRALSIEPREYSLRGTLLRPNTLLQVHRLARQMKANGTLLLHCHDFYSNIVGSLAAREAGIPYIVSRRDMGAWLDWKRKQLVKLATRLATRVLVNAYAVRDQLIHTEGIAASQITVIHNGLDIDGFDREAARPLASPLPAIDRHGPVVAMVGNLKHVGKGHAETVIAAAAVLRVLPECRFLLIGDGELRPALEQQARDLGIGHAILFAGKRTDVPALLARSHVAISASHSEGLSNAIMEGMAARLPIVATGVGGNIELVRDGRTGFIVRKADPAGLAQRLIEVLRDPTRAKQMGLAGRRRIEDEFSTRNLSERTSSLYCDMLGLTKELRRAAA